MVVSLDLCSLVTVTGKRVVRSRSGGDLDNHTTETDL